VFSKNIVFWYVRKYTRDDAFIKLFGERVRDLRLKKNLSQEELANLTNLEISQINRIELGKINTSISHVKVLADALELKPKDLFDFF
jgi:transcriptional regulator with XRE-family HTH domain